MDLVQILTAIFKTVPPHYVSTAALLVVIFWLFRDRQNLLKELIEQGENLKALVTLVDILVKTGINNQKK